MARRVFFSFHYERDVWRASQIRNSWLLQPDREAAGFWDNASWESVKKQGEDAVKRWIKQQLENTSVTVVLIGAETSTREYVGYEIVESCNRGNGLLGVYIHNQRDRNGFSDTQGRNPLDNWTITQNGIKVPLSQIYPSYDWVANTGYVNFKDWIENAAVKAGR